MSERISDKMVREIIEVSECCDSDEWAVDEWAVTEMARELLEARQQLAAAPAWHDRPTGPGNWVCRWGSAGEYTRVVEHDGRLHMLSRLEPCDNYPHCKWYGPIPDPHEPAQAPER